MSEAKGGSHIEPAHFARKGKIAKRRCEDGIAECKSTSCTHFGCNRVGRSELDVLVAFVLWITMSREIFGSLIHDKTCTDSWFLRSRSHEPDTWCKRHQILLVVTFPC